VSVKPLAFGLDLGGTKMHAIVLDNAGQTLWQQRIATPAQHYPSILQSIAALVDQAASALGVNALAFGIGIGLPGSFSRRTGLVKNANTTVLNGQDLKSDLLALLKQPVALENDANCFVLSEATDGAGATASTVFGVILGTGVGGGLSFNKRLWPGLHHVAGEWGHNPMPDSHLPMNAMSPVRCYCGRFNCIETFLSGPGWLAREKVFLHQASNPHELAPHELSTQAIVQASQHHQAWAQAAVERYCKNLAVALGSVINVLDPDVIVLGGGMGGIAQIYPLVQQYLPEFVFSDEVLTPVVPPQFGDASGVRGAAWLGAKQMLMA
jgi:fructokinase